MAIRKEALACPAFQALKEVYDDRDKSALEWKRAGKKVVAQLGCDVPDELIIAGGMLPVRVYADPERPLTLTDRYLEFSFDPIVRAQFERLVDGGYCELADYLAISNSTDVLIRVFLYLREIRRSEPECKVPELDFIDWLFTRNRMHQERNEMLLRLFWETVEQWAGRKISDDELRAAAKLCNEDRAALREIRALRRAEGPRVNGSEALVIIGSSLFMDKAKHAKLTREVAEAAQSWPVLTGPRVFYTGSVQESTALYEMIEAAGAVVVGEDHDWGDRHYDRDYNMELSPVRALVNRYMLRQFSSKKAFVSQRVEALDTEVDNAAAQGVLFFMNIYEEAASWDYPSQRKSLEGRGIATAACLKQRYPIGVNEALEESIAAFVGSLKGGVR